MREEETVLEYFARMKKISDGAAAGLTETFEAEQVTVMKNMLAGITLEAFKRGLTDEHPWRTGDTGRGYEDSATHRTHDEWKRPTSNH